MNPIIGSCHCGNIQYEFIHPDFDPNSDAKLPVRRCTCSFCIKHGGIYTSHPKGALNVQIEDESFVHRYQFGTKSAHFYICKRCGIFPFVTSEVEGNTYAVVNVNTFDNVNHDNFIPADTDFEAEDVTDRLGRRTQTWISTVTIENNNP